MTVTGRPAVLYPIILTSFSGASMKKNNKPKQNRRLQVCDQTCHALVRKLTTPENTITYYNALCLSPQNFA